jgi:hypothetical protein
MAAVPPLNREWLQAPNGDTALLVASQEFERALRDWTTRAGIPLLVGTEAIVPQRDNPKAAELHNSAIRFDPGLGQNAQRQDKQRLFPLAESIPFRGTFIHTLLEQSVASHSSVPIGRRVHAWRAAPGLRASRGDRNEPAAPLRGLDVRRALLRRKLRHVFARGESWTGMGAPELPRIAALVKFRRDHAAELATDPALAAHVTSEIAAIEELRRTAGVSGQSTQPVYVDSRRTLYSRIGDVFPWVLVIFTGAGFLALFGQSSLAARGKAKTVAP